MNSLIDYETIIQSISGDTQAAAAVLKHFDAYINKLSMKIQKAPDGTAMRVIDEDVKIELQIELIMKLSEFNMERYS